jgi:hypothetical protein
MARKRRIETDRLEIEQDVDDFIGGIGNYTIAASQYADTRAVSRGVLSPNEELFATSGWSGYCKVWGKISIIHWLTLF